MRKFCLSLIILVILSTNLFSQTYYIYVSDAGNFANPPWQILKFDENGENPIIFIDENIQWPQDILFIDNQDIVIISNFSSGTITKHNNLTGEYEGYFATGLSAPTRMKIGPDGLLYVLQWGGNGKVLRYNLEGEFIDVFTNTGVTQSIGIDWDTQGNLYVSSYNGDNVHKFDEDGDFIELFITTDLLGPTDIWFDENGDLLVSDYNGVAVKRFNSNGAYIGDFIQGINKSEGVDFFPNGNILIGNGSTNSVKMFDSEGNYISDLIESGSGGLLNPNAIVIRETNPVTIGSYVEKENVIIIVEKQNNIFQLNSNLDFIVDVIELMDTTGKIMDVINLSQTQELNANNYAKGIYILIGKTNNKIVGYQKIIIN